MEAVVATITTKVDADVADAIKGFFMDENSLFTPFDEITQTRELQMLKTIIPYMPHDSQKQMTLMVHYISLMNSMRMIDSAPALSVAETESMSDRRLSMLNALKKYCSKSEQDTIDNLLNIFSVLDNREIYDKAGIFK